MGAGRAVERVAESLPSTSSMFLRAKRQAAGHVRQIATPIVRGEDDERVVVALIGVQQGLDGHEDAPPQHGIGEDPLAERALPGAGARQAALATGAVHWAAV